MGKNKLRKFADMAEFANVYQYPFAALEREGFPYRGHWAEQVFHNQNPIVLELGCGKGEYTVGLARRFPERNFIGIDIKGARMWTGAKEALEQNIANAAFLRTSIELIDRFFAPGEVAELWITFPDPQMKKVNKRLTGTRFLTLYRRILAPDAIINLKTDSPFLYTYTRAMAAENALPLLTDTADLYGSGIESDVLDIRTHYERQWLARGLTIKYLRFSLPATETPLCEPDIDIEFDTYRSYSRGVLQSPDTFQSPTAQ